MFPKTRNIETAFQHVRLFTIVIVAGSLLLDGFIAWQSYRARIRAQSTIYVLNSGKALEAFAADRKENIPVEARDHIRAFHQLFFSLDPDERQITATVTRALYLADASAKRLYDNLKESGYYAGIISGNISQEVVVDSISLNMHSYPWYFRCYATEKIIRPTSLVTRDLLTEGWLRNISRSENDPHGLLIERWSILDNRDIQVSAR
ncbi:MAG TPA: conjugative transposon protein TraK [Puia sp.]|jgi:conjugative transposon TraK protein